MADPSKFTRTYSFTDYQASNPSAPLPGLQVDAELEDVEASIGEIVDAIKDVRRSDGALKNGIVTVDSLDATVAAGVGSGALASAAAAAASADAASDSAVAAAASASAAGISENAASGYASYALTSRNEAATERTLAQTARTGAQTARDFANKWAVEAEGVLVDDGVNDPDYSAYHWAQVALGAATGALPDGSVSTPKIVDGAVTLPKVDAEVLNAANHTGRRARDFLTVSDMLADTDLAYTGTTSALTVSEGQDVFAQGFRYKVAASATIGARYAKTAGGVSLWVDGPVLYPHQFFENVGQGIEERDTEALAAAIDALAGGFGGTVALFAEELKIGDTIQLRSKVDLVGKGRYASKIDASGCIGVPLFDMGDVSLVGVTISDLYLVGNNATGASGNGHCFQFIDPDVRTGTHLPQLIKLADLRIEKFRGLGKANYAGTETVEASAVFHNGGLGCVTEYLSISRCGRGIVRYSTQNCRDMYPIIDRCDMVGILDLRNENYMCFGADVVGCGFGVDGSLNYPEVTGMHPTNIMSRLSEGPQYIGLKSKDSGGKANVVVAFSENATFEGGWFQATQSTDIADSNAKQVQKAFYVEQAPGTKIKNNLFHLVAPRRPDTVYEVIEAIGTQTFEPFSGLEIEGNTFGYAAGANTATAKVSYYIRVAGNSGSRLITGLKVTNNQTRRAAPSAPCDVDHFFLTANANLSKSEIKDNTVHAPTGVTIKYGFSAGSMTLSDGAGVEVKNAFSGTGAGATAQYNGWSESVLYGSATYDPASLAANASINTGINVPGAEMGDFVEVSFSNDMTNVTLTGVVSAANVVRAIFQKDGNATAVDLASGTLRARVKKRWG